MNPNLYQACQGKGMVYLEQDETEEMLKCFANAKEGAMSKNNTKAIEQINGVIDSYYNKLIFPVKLVHHNQYFSGTTGYIGHNPSGHSSLLVPRVAGRSEQEETSKDKKACQL